MALELLVVRRAVWSLGFNLFLGLESCMRSCIGLYQLILLKKICESLIILPQNALVVGMFIFLLFFTTQENEIRFI